MIIAILAILSLLYLFIDLWLLRGLSKLKATPRPTLQDFKVSILVAARNEETGIENCLRKILNQDYPSHLIEIWVTDDRSTDKTLEILKKIQSNEPRLKILESPEIPLGHSPKKNSLQNMIARSTGEILLTTDADCLVEPTWVSSMVAQFKEETHMVVGFSSFVKDASISKCFFGLQALEFVSHFVVSAAAIANRLPINSSGNNLAYRKSSYERLGGFTGLEKIISGDDDLLLHRFSQDNADGVVFNIDPKSHVLTFAMPTLGALWNQRKRWASKTVYYSPKVVVLLSTVFFFYFTVALSLLAFIWGDFLLFVWGGLAFILKTFMDYLVLRKGTQVFSKRNFLPYFWPTSLVHIPLIVGAVLFGVFGKFNWKDRKTAK